MSLFVEYVRMVASMKWFLIVVGLAFAYLIIDRIITYRRLRHFRGPTLAAFSEIWTFLQWTRSRTHYACAESLEKYGPVCRVGPNLLVTDDVDLLHHVSGPRSRWTRSVWYTVNKFDPRADSVFSTRDEKAHAELRSREIGAYSGKDVDNIEAEIDTTITELLTLLRKTYDGQVVDLSEIVQWFTLDVMSRIAFGSPFGNLRANQDVFAYKKATSEFFPIAELLLNHGFFRALLANSFVQKVLAPKDTDTLGLGRVVKFARECVSDRFGPDGKVQRDMLGALKDKGLSQLQCEVEANLQILAGSDSTSSVLRNTLFLLIGNPVAYAKLKTEVDAAVGSGSISYPVVTYAEAEQLKYVDACVWEGMRMYPPLFGLKTKLAPKGGDTFDGIFYPEGTELGQVDSAICRKKSEWGNDPHVFRPDRWIEANVDTRQRYEKVVSQIFGAGRYTCLGKHIAMVELHKVLVELVRNFDWVISDPLRGVNMIGHSAWIQSHMDVNPYGRS